MSETALPLIQSSPKRAGAWTFGILFLIESMARAFSLAVLSIQAYDLLGSSQRVSELGVVTSLIVLIITLCMPMVFGRLRRRWAYTTGALLLAAGSVALATFSLPGQIAGVIMRNAGASIANVTLQLYILDNIHKDDLTRSEPLRLGLSTFAWVVCPYAGVFMYQHYGPAATQACALAASLTLLCVFWYLRLHDPHVMPSGTIAVLNPVSNVKRFVAQPRLRLAWLVAFTRSAFWMSVFTYGPLLMIEGGLGKEAGGAMISYSQMLLLTSFAFGYAAKRLGLRLVITFCIWLLSCAALIAGGFGLHAPYLAAGFLLLGGLGASGLDAVGAIPYLRAVKFHERQRMTSVYRSFLEMSDLVPSMIYAVALRFFDVSVVFVIIGSFAMCVSAVAWRYLPKGM